MAVCGECGHWDKSLLCLDETGRRALCGRSIMGDMKLDSAPACIHFIDKLCPGWKPREEADVRSRA